MEHGNWRIETQVFLNIPEGRGVHIRQEKVGRPNSQETHISVRKGMSRVPQVITKENTTSYRWVQGAGSTQVKQVYNYFLFKGTGIPGSRILIKIYNNSRNMWPLNTEHAVNVDGAGNWSFYVEYNGDAGFTNNIEIKQVENYKHYSLPNYFPLNFKVVRLTMDHSRRRLN